MRIPKNPIVLIVVGVVIGLILAYKVLPKMSEGFQDSGAPVQCLSCGQASCPAAPDMSKYILKSSIPPPPTCPDMTGYMLKTQCPPTPDLSQYILKSSVPTPEPIIVDNSSCGKDCATARPARVPDAPM